MNNGFKLASFTCGHQIPVRGYDRSLNRPCPSCLQDGRSPKGAPHTVPAMNSVEALDYALRDLRFRHRYISQASRQAEHVAAITTLEALREHIVDQQQTAERERAIVDDWVDRAGAPLRDEKGTLSTALTPTAFDPCQFRLKTRGPGIAVCGLPRRDHPVLFSGSANHDFESGTNTTRSVQP